MQLCILQITWFNPKYLYSNQLITSQFLTITFFVQNQMNNVKKELSRKNYWNLERVNKKQKNAINAKIAAIIIKILIHVLFTQIIILFNIIILFILFSYNDVTYMHKQSLQKASRKRRNSAKKHSSRNTWTENKKAEKKSLSWRDITLTSKLTVFSNWLGSNRLRWLMQLGLSGDIGGIETTKRWLEDSSCLLRSTSKQTLRVRRHVCRRTASTLHNVMLTKH